jgi:hypothetical protein
MAQKRRSRSSGQQRAAAETRRIEGARNRKRRNLAIVAGVIALSFVASTVGAVVLSLR